MTTNYIGEWGLERCYDMLNNKPDRTATHLIIDTGHVYFSVDFGSYFNNEEHDWYDSDYRTEEDLINAYANVINLDKLQNELWNHEIWNVTHVE